ncbi:MAG: TIGR00268 family protein [Thermoplasmata archaeon]|nr:TIGR00268 family protein [Thermoplasmata archaeon]
MKAIVLPESLRVFFEDNPSPALAFSGGTDSSFLLYACKMLDVDVRPYFVKGAFQTLEEIHRANDFSEMLGYDLTEVELDVLSDYSIRRNGTDRCYQCKKHVFGSILKKAKEDGCRFVMDGTNASDDYSTRPGMRALMELGVRSPLRECGLTKPQIRLYSKCAELPSWNIPTDSCLATRIPFGMEITDPLLRRTEEVEKELKNLGFRNFRVRTRNYGAHLEMDPAQKDLLKETEQSVRSIILSRYDSITYGERVTDQSSQLDPDLAT